MHAWSREEERLVPLSAPECAQLVTRLAVLESHHACLTRRRRLFQDHLHTLPTLRVRRAYSAFGRAFHRLTIERNRIEQELRVGRGVRPVLVWYTPDYVAGRMRVEVCGEVVEDRPLRAEERQLAILR